MGSRSIVLDPVHDRIEHIRYGQHKRSLHKIYHAHSPLAATDSELYSSQLDKFKKSNSFVKHIFDPRTI